MHFVKLLALSLLIGLGWLWALPASAEEDFRISLLKPDQVFQGDTVFILVEPSIHLTRLSVDFLQEKVPAYPFKAGYLGLLGIPADLKEGDYLVTVEGRDEKGEVREKNFLIRVSDKGYGKENITLPPAKKSLPESPKLKVANKIVRKQLFVESTERFWEKNFIPPASGPVTAPFGTRRILNGKISWGYHSGVDFLGNKGDSVIAPAPGKILLAEELEVFGGTIVVDHGQGVISIFQHLSKFDVKKGDTCYQGQKIGEIGSTGLATGPHLHWGLYVHGTKVDPLTWLHLPQKMIEPGSFAATKKAG